MKQTQLFYKGDCFSCYVCYTHVFSFLFIEAGTDVMLLDNFSTDGSSHLHHHGNLSGKRRSSVTFEDQVEHSKGMCHEKTTLW